LLQEIEVPVPVSKSVSVGVLARWFRSVVSFEFQGRSPLSATMPRAASAKPRALAVTSLRSSKSTKGSIERASPISPSAEDNEAWVASPFDTRGLGHLSRGRCWAPRNVRAATSMSMYARPHWR
jgi:hypothetical protein